MTYAVLVVLDGFDLASLRVIKAETGRESWRQLRNWHEIKSPPLYKDSGAKDLGMTA